MATRFNEPAPVRRKGSSIPPESKPRRRSALAAIQLSRFEMAALVAALAIANAYFLAAGRLPVLHDAAGYLRGANDIARNGLFSKFDLSDIRAYGWPFLLSWLVRISGALHIPLRVLALEVLLVAHLIASICLRQAVRACGAPRGFSLLVFVAVVAHPLVLIYPSYLLSESAAFTLIILLLAACAWLVSPAGKSKPYRILACGSFLLGFSIMVRPGNVCLVPVWGLAIVLAWLFHRPGLAAILRQGALAVVFLAVPAVPQFLNNVKFYGRYTPMLANNYGGGQWWLGIRWIEYVTSQIDGENPQVYYLNPFYDGQPVPYDRPLTWYAAHPAQGLATTALHAFNLLNQDFPLPYNPTLTPWYYPANALANMFFVSCGLFGMAVSVRFALRAGRVISALHALAAVTFLLLTGMHSTMAVEVRWGVPGVMILYIFAGWLLFSYLPRSTMARRMTVLGAATALTCVSYPLSQWVRRQSPAIMAAETAKHPPEILPGKNFVSGELNRWALVRAGVSRDGEAVLFSPKGAVSLMGHPVELRRDTDYVAEFEARGEMACDLSVDLYGGPAYDRAEQNSTVTAPAGGFRLLRGRWNSGSDAPENAFLRFATLCRTPIRIRNVSFRAVSGH